MGNISPLRVERASETDLSRDYNIKAIRPSSINHFKQSLKPTYDEVEYELDSIQYAKSDQEEIILIPAKRSLHTYKGIRKSQENLGVRPLTSQGYFKHTATNKYGTSLPSAKLDKYTKHVYTLVKKHDEDVIRNMGYRPISYRSRKEASGSWRRCVHIANPRDPFKSSEREPNPSKTFSHIPDILKHLENLEKESEELRKRQTELERKLQDKDLETERLRQAELDRLRQLEVDRARQAELDRKAEFGRKTELNLKTELDRIAELERQADLDRQAKLDQQLEIERLRKLANQRERDRQAELDRLNEMRRQEELEKIRKLKLEEEKQMKLKKQLEEQTRRELESKEERTRKELVDIDKRNMEIEDLNKHREIMKRLGVDLDEIRRKDPRLFEELMHVLEKENYPLAAIMAKQKESSNDRTIADAELLSYCLDECNYIPKQIKHCILANKNKIQTPLSSFKRKDANHIKNDIIEQAISNLDLLNTPVSALNKLFDINPKSQGLL